MDTHITSQQIKNQVERIILQIIFEVLEKLCIEITDKRKGTTDLKF